MELTMVKARVKRGMMPRSMVGSESFCGALWRCDNGRGESVGFEGRCWKRSRGRFCRRVAPGTVLETVMDQ